MSPQVSVDRANRLRDAPAGHRVRRTAPEPLSLPLVTARSLNPPAAEHQDADDYQRRDQPGPGRLLATHPDRPGGGPPHARLLATGCPYGGCQRRSAVRRGLLAIGLLLAIGIRPVRTVLSAADSS